MEVLLGAVGEEAPRLLRNLWLLRIVHLQLFITTMQDLSNSMSPTMSVSVHSLFRSWTIYFYLFFVSLV